MAVRIPTRRTIAAAVAATTVTLLLGACGDRTDAGGGGGAGGTGGAKSDAPLFAELPADIRRAGVIKVGTDATYAPME
ncbi:ABC transporter substrate-binding protein, partial [Streptomyces nojiriensis]